MSESQMIYADNAATTQLDEYALEAMLPFLKEQYANASQPYSFSRSAKRALRSAREDIALCLNANPENIIFTSCGTECDNWVIKGLALVHSKDWQIATSCIEHHAILNPCKWLESQGYTVNYLSVDAKGVTQADYFNGIDLVSVMYANNEIGTIQPVKKICERAHEFGALFHTDAVQAVGHLKIDVEDLGVDFLSASAHKFNGPKGIGFLYAKEPSKLRPLINGGAQEFGLRAGTENIASIVGMATALKRNCAEIEVNAKKLLSLEKLLLQTLKQQNIDFIRNGAEEHVPGNISLSFKDQEGEALLHRLDFAHICVSTGSACDSQNTQISHVLQAIGLPEEYAKGTIRISLGKNNTEEDVVAIAKALISVLI